MTIQPFKEEDLVEIDEKTLLTRNPIIGFNDLFDNKENVVVAGGLWRARLVGDYISDVDVFWIKDNSQFKDLGFEILGRDVTESLIASGVYKGIKYQFVNRPYKSVSDIFKSFDYTICLFAYNNKKLYSTNLAIEDSKNKRLRINIIQPLNGINTLKRMIKYSKKGYNPRVEDILEISKHIHSLDDEDIAYQIQFDGNGVPRFDDDTV